MTRKIFYALFVQSLIMLYSCDPPSNSAEIADKLAGKWNCDEISTIYNENSYNVTIKTNPDNLNSILIDNFYSLGTGINIVADINGMGIVIARQTTYDGSIVEGHGNISSDYNTITLNYTVDINDGNIDNVSATYSFQY
jgi:hypothetical protein